MKRKELLTWGIFGPSDVEALEKKDIKLRLFECDSKQAGCRYLRISLFACRRAGQKIGFRRLFL